MYSAKSLTALPIDYTGSGCQYTVTPCDNSFCNDHGVCAINGDGNEECVCDAG